MKPDLLSAVKEEAMKEVWRQFEKILWKQRQIEESTLSGWKTFQEEIQQWEDYAFKHYTEPMPFTPMSTY